MLTDTVSNEEVLYRCVFYGRNCYRIEEDGTVRISSQAFNDRNMAPSVDRACLCNYQAGWTQKNERDGVVSLITLEVRMIDTVNQKDAKGNLIFSYKIDVYPRPIINDSELPDNPAHAQIEPTPQYQNKSVFRKLLERLAILASQRDWEIPPYELRR